ncbi:MAG: efflux RND transporter permease subunit [Wenzhouxiangella sp.]|nr:efflux RND transporter permease subunit [Wenzhouxiangella sp.]
MSPIAHALSRRRLILTGAGLLALIGLFAWLGMDRQEDPFFPYRYGHIMASWPGADPEQVERLVLKPLEEALAGIEEVREIRGTARLGLAHLIVGMNQEVYDTDAVWNRVRSAMDRAERRLPRGAGPIEVHDRSMDTHGIVLAVTGSDDLLVLLEAARQLRRDLFAVPDIGRIDLLGDPGEALEIAPDPSRLIELGMDMAQLARVDRRCQPGVAGR